MTTGFSPPCHKFPDKSCAARNALSLYGWLKHHIKNRWNAPKLIHTIPPFLIQGCDCNDVISHVCFSCIKHEWTTSYLSVYLVMSARKRRRPADLNSKSRRPKLTSAHIILRRESVLHSIPTVHCFVVYFSSTRTRPSMSWLLFTHQCATCRWWNLEDRRSDLLESRSSKL